MGAKFFTFSIAAIILKLMKNHLSSTHAACQQSFSVFQLPPSFGKKLSLCFCLRGLGSMRDGNGGPTLGIPNV